MNEGEHMGATPRLEATCVAARYGRQVPVLRDVTFSCKPGLTLLLGPNGVGKSTLMSVLAGAQRAMAGSIDLVTEQGVLSPGTIRTRTGFMPQSPSFRPRMTGRQCVEYVAWLRKVPRGPRRDRSVSEVLDMAHAAHVADVPWARMSYGTRQRVAIAAALVNRPVLLLLDEPLNGLDIAEKHSLIEVVSDLAKTTIAVVSSHVVQGLEHRVDDIVVLGKGTVRHAGPAENLVAEFGGLEQAYLALQAG